MRYFEVSNSWKPDSPKLKTMSFICCEVFLLAVDFEDDVFLELIEPRVAARLRAAGRAAAPRAAAP